MLSGGPVELSRRGFLFATAVLAAACVRSAPGARVRLASGERGGLYLAFAELVAKQLQARYSDIGVDAISTEGSVDNLAQLRSGHVDLGLALADIVERDLATGRYLETTDDAYVKADSTIIAPKVSGYISEVLVADNEPVKAGQLLARIDGRDFTTALNQAKADITASEAAVRNLDAQIELQEPLIPRGQLVQP